MKPMFGGCSGLCWGGTGNSNFALLASISGDSNVGDVNWAAAASLLL
jgi:hypothetical protein